MNDSNHPGIATHPRERSYDNGSQTHPRRPAQHHPYLGIEGAAKAIEFYKKAFNAVEMFRLEGPDGRIGHAELKIGDSSLMLADPCNMPDSLKATQSIKDPAVGLHLYVKDCDKIYAQATPPAPSRSRN